MIGDICCHQVNKSFELGKPDESYHRGTPCCLSRQPVGRRVSESPQQRAATSAWGGGLIAQHKTLPGNPMSPQSALPVGRSLGHEISVAPAAKLHVITGRRKSHENHHLRRGMCGCGHGRRDKRPLATSPASFLG